MEKPARRLSPARVEGDSMSPALRAGSLVAVSPLRGEPTRGSIVVVRRSDGAEHLKRLAALPGESFEGRVLGPDEYAVLGDNRTASTDSRHYGPVRREDIVAIARLCYWPPRAWRVLRTTRRA
jgi:phage repressor protein C with HTH and peptisase S24 domain